MSGNWIGAWAALVLAAAPAYGAQMWAAPDLDWKLTSGHWNERIYSVNKLGLRGESAFPSLRKAMQDPDWQVRLTAAHWLGKLGKPAAATLTDALVREKCPLVRLAVANKLGGLGVESRALSPSGKAEDFSACQSWTWPLTDDYIHTRKKKTMRTESTPLDQEGCQYIQYRRSGGAICPSGFILKGVGEAPGHVGILKKKWDLKTGVALCCRADVIEGAAGSAAEPEPPKPQAIECRLHPIECPSPWIPMEGPDRRHWSRRERKYRRTSQMRKGGIDWVHCCRPHDEKAQDAFPPAENDPARTPQAPPREDPVEEELQDYVEEEDAAAYEDFESMPEAEIAEKALARVDSKTREKAFDTLLTALELEFPDNYEPTPEGRLSAPEGLGERRIRPISAEARREDSSRDNETPELDRPREDLGPSERRLGAPKGLRGREEKPVRAPAGIMADGGKIVRHDPLPGLIQSMRHASSRRRSRAADEIGHLGPRGLQAVMVLKKALKDKSPRVRSSAALALSNITVGSDRALKELKRMLKDKNADVRYSAAQGLGRIGTPASRKAFNRHMRGETLKFLRVKR